MESNYNNENFEHFLRESSDQYRMYPSENVWKNIYNILHTRRRWFGIGLILLLSAGFVTTIMLTNSSVPGNKQIAAKETSATIPAKESIENTDAENIPITSYGNNTRKDKTTLLQPLILQADNPNNAVIATEIPGEEVLKKDMLAETVEEKTGTHPEEIVTNNPLLQNKTVYSPLAIHITDETMDQDAFIMNINFLNNDRVIKKGAYNVNAAVNRPLTIESVINSYTRRNKKVSFQYYFTPTISYRKLSENKSYLRSQNSGASNYAALYGNINNVVTHKPDMGLEVGIAARYTLNKRIKLRGGIQFNTSRYDIKAFSYASEFTTIALNTGSTVDSLSTISNYRNFNGYKSDWLHNFYFQISTPVGIELKLAGDDKVQFGIAGTLQPTYILGDRAYLLSSNYKNYAEVPWLIRKWNMNTSLEAFVSYSTGKMNWQIGPQVRYQLFSSFVKEYPVKENLFDFGLKIGVSVNK
ncbi:MAG: hypothetical protein WDO19_26265 [Bacteroidota bacterium]